ncbi:L-threonylcarbamoyladenylate synthase [Brumimicrobium aurantiacum]|uniref:L-threonylcarbamoyladenylate synthase n=1 Tax=Brumimicrobium aurantiacum TaxID=1737063 RepID=A0A3E1EWA2_9FLAO|nr:L-threonylcarbamoyladenylate synthase [Brumimicrobium aurantiacum]RFC53773.1 threonylcarbamoyl-AMP synthase [Brumimicrobium aurantiacum]
MEKKVNIHEAAEGLKNGKTILYPTDTVWGIGCDASNEEAIQKVNEIKNRDGEKSFIVLVDSVAMLERYVTDFPDVCYDLIDFTEEPLTIIYDQPRNLPKALLAKDGSIGIRVTNDMNCKKLIQKIRKPLVSTSANISGKPTATQFDEIDESIISSVDLILNERTKEVMRKPSSIIKVGSNHNVKVIR